MREKSDRKDGIIEIRAHHGLCIAFFRGKGYSEAFTAHMAGIIGRLKEETKILLTEREDDICFACPNLTENGCNEKEKVKAFDRRAMELCGLFGEEEAGEAPVGRRERIVSWKQFQKAVEENITGCGRRREVCGECEWDEVCEAIAGRRKKEL